MGFSSGERNSAWPIQEITLENDVIDTVPWKVIHKDQSEILKVLLNHGLQKYVDIAQMLLQSIELPSTQCTKLLAERIHNQNGCHLLSIVTEKGMSYVKPIMELGYKYNADFLRTHPSILPELLQ